LLPTFVIGLREGVEAALIVGIIAAFLRQENRTDALRYVWIGVGVAALLCAAVGVTLQIVNEDLPQKQQEGLETAVFLLAAFQSAANPGAAGAGAVIGVAVAVAIGWGIYRGGVRLNLARFFRLTALVLVLVAAGLLASAAHTAHEAGWLNFLQDQALDLSWLIVPGSVTSSLLTGMLGLQPQPTVAEAAVYLLYAVPMAAYVLWPQRSRPRAPAPQTA
jgi:high-affinity iron transporter